MRTSRLVVAAMATALLAGACGAGSATPSPSAASAAPSVAATTAATASAAPSASAAAASPSAAAQAITIAAVIPNTSDPFWTTIACSAQAEAGTLGVTLKEFTTTGTDTNQIAQLFNSASLLNPRGLFVNPFNNNQFATQYKDLMAKGVVVTTGNGTQPQVDYKTIQSGTDTEKLVPQVAALLPTGSGTMVFMGGAPGIPPLESRTQPFWKALQAARTDLKALDTEYSGFDINKATSDANSLIIAHPDLKVIVAADGPDGQAAAAAVKQSGKVGKVAVIAFDAIPSEVQALKDGTITALIAQNPGQIGVQGIKDIVDYLQAHPGGGAVSPAGVEYISNGVLTKDNVDDPSNASFVYKAGC